MGTASSNHPIGVRAYRVSCRWKGARSIEEMDFRKDSECLVALGLTLFSSSADNCIGAFGKRSRIEFAV